MVLFVAEKKKQKCEICGKEFEYATYGEPVDILHSVHDAETGKLIGVEIAGIFICSECFPKLVRWAVRKYKMGDLRGDTLIG